MLIKTTKLADAVLACIDFNSSPDERFIVETYHNGRENGYAICNSDGLKVVFSEYRKSDEVVVYFSDNFSGFDDNTPTEEVYEKKKFFSSIESASEFIVKYLRFGNKANG